MPLVSSIVTVVSAGASPSTSSSVMATAGSVADSGVPATAASSPNGAHVIVTTTTGPFRNQPLFSPPTSTGRSEISPSRAFQVAHFVPS